MIRPHRFRTNPGLLGCLLLACAVCAFDPSTLSAAGSPHSRIRVVRTVEAPNDRCRLIIAMPGRRNTFRSFLVRWSPCRDFDIAQDVTLAQLQDDNQLFDLPRDVVRTMRRNESKGLIELGGDSTFSVIYVDDSGHLREVFIAD